MAEVKTYMYKLLKENEKSIQIEVPTRDKKKIYQFYIPKSACKKIEKIEMIREFGKKENMVEITIEPELMYKFTWLKIQKWMEKKGFGVKTWNKKM